MILSAIKTGDKKRKLKVILLLVCIAIINRIIYFSMAYWHESVERKFFKVVENISALCYLSIVITMISHL
jgi:hypothetical protein